MYFFHEHLGWLALSLLFSNRFVDGQSEPSPRDRLGFSIEYVERAVDGDWHYGQSYLAGKHEGTALERYHLAIVRAGSFGEDDHRHAALQCLACLIYSLADG